MKKILAALVAVTVKGAKRPFEAVWARNLPMTRLSNHNQAGTRGTERRITNLRFSKSFTSSTR